MNPEQLHREFWERVSEQNQLQRLRLWLSLEWDTAQEGLRHRRRPARKFVYVGAANGKPIIIGSINMFAPAASRWNPSTRGGTSSIAALECMAPEPLLVLAWTLTSQPQSILDLLKRRLPRNGQGAIFFADRIELMFQSMCRVITSKIGRNQPH